MKYLNWITAILGAVLFIAPFLFSYSGVAGPLWTSLILGVLIAVLGYIKQYKWAAGMGAVAFIAGILFGFGGVPAAAWSGVILGGLVGVLNGYQGWFSEEAKSGTVQHGHA